MNIGLNRNMKKQQIIKQFNTYEIQTELAVYYVTVWIKFYVKEPDYNTWDSDLDYFGYTELVDAKITFVLTLDENMQETVVEFNQLPKGEQIDIAREVDKFVNEQEIDYD